MQSLQKVPVLSFMVYDLSEIESFNDLLKATHGNTSKLKQKPCAWIIGNSHEIKTLLLP